MNKKWRSSLKYFRLTLAFALIVFLIILVTMSLIFFGTIALTKLGLVEAGRFERFPLFAFCLMSIAVGTILAAVFSKAPLKPFRELMDATDRVASGDYSARIDLKGPEELKQLSQKFNHMVAEIGSVEMLRTDFVNNFSHEFKTPIASIRGFAKALKWDDLTEQEREEYLDIIISESERLSALSSNVLYLSKIENQAILTEQQNYNLSEQIRLVIALLNHKFSEKQLGIIFDSQEYFITGNREMLKQVWINLLDNAIKFSPNGGKIEVAISQDDEKTYISVSNEGEPIPPDVQAHIFDRFYQGDKSHATAGNGLGLSIVKKIVDLHGGRVDIISANQEITVKVSLPLPMA